MQRIHRYRAGQAAPLFGMALLLLLAAGCSESGPPRAGIAGQVVVGGKPLAAGRILFLPMAPTEGPAASAGIVNGEYRLTAEEGPAVGRNRVEVEADLPLGFAIDDEQAYARRGGKRLPPQPISAQYNRNSQLVAQVEKVDQNRFDVTIPAAGQTAQSSARYTGY